MKSIFSYFKDKKPDVEALPFTARPAPETPLFVIGDIHGRLDLLRQILIQRPSGAQLVFVGDLVDRGPDSPEVLNLVQDLCEQGAICLMGNHELMLLDFISNPIERGNTWLSNGGLQTLASFGVKEIRERMEINMLPKVRDQFETIIQKDQLDWLRALPLHWASGNIHCVHAGADPQKSMQEQESPVLLWGTSAFTKKPRQDGKWVVHGHTIVSQACIHDGRISIDTGAFATGILTGAYIHQDHIEFFTAEE